MENHKVNNLHFKVSPLVNNLHFKLGFLLLFCVLILSVQETTCMHQNPKKVKLNKKQVLEDKNCQNNGYKTWDNNAWDNNQNSNETSSLPLLTINKKNLLAKEPKSPKNNKVPRLLITHLANNTNQKFNFQETNSPNSPTWSHEKSEEINEPEKLMCNQEKDSPEPQVAPFEKNDLQEPQVKPFEENDLQESQVTPPEKFEKTEKFEEISRPEKNFHLMPTKHEKSFCKKPLDRKKSFKNLLKKINIEFKIHKTKNAANKTKKILGVNGTIFFCDIRNFTFFSNQCLRDETPAFFMTDFSVEAKKIFKYWNASLISTAGDSYVVIFPKKRTELSVSESFKNAILCSIEFVCKMSEFIKTKKQEHFPKRFDLGLEVGMTYFYKLGQSKDIVPIAVVAKTINNAQRYEDHCKKSKDRKITIPTKIYNSLSNYEPIKQLFTLETFLEAKGIKSQFVRSASEKNIEAFYKSPDWKIFTKPVIERNSKDNLPEDLNTLLETL